MVWYGMVYVGIIISYYTVCAPRSNVARTAHRRLGRTSAKIPRPATPVHGHKTTGFHCQCTNTCVVRVYMIICSIYVHVTHTTDAVTAMARDKSVGREYK